MPEPNPKPQCPREQGCLCIWPKCEYPTRCLWGFKQWRDTLMVERGLDPNESVAKFLMEKTP